MPAGAFTDQAQGIAVIVILLLILTFYLWNRFYRRRIGPNPKRRSLRNVIPAFSFSGPTPDPYNTPTSANDGLDNRSYPARPGMARQVSGASEWELESDAGVSPAEYSGAGAQGWKGKGKANGPTGSSNGGSTDYMGVGIGLPTVPHEAALPIRSRSPSARSVSEFSDRSSRSMSGRKLSQHLDVNTRGPRGSNGHAHGLVNPFDSPQDGDTARLSPMSRSPDQLVSSQDTHAAHQSPMVKSPDGLLSPEDTYGELRGDSVGSEQSLRTPDPLHADDSIR